MLILATTYFLLVVASLYKSYCDFISMDESKPLLKRMIKWEEKHGPNKAASMGAIFVMGKAILVPIWLVYTMYAKYKQKRNKRI